MTVLSGTSKAKFLRTTSLVRFSRGSPLCEASFPGTPEATARLCLFFFSQDKIMEMECELLVSSLKTPKTLELVNENIGRIGGGSSSHSAHALKLGLKKAFDLKKRPLGARLRCPMTNCAWYRNPVSMSSIGISVMYCQSCRGYNRYLQCANCGYNRTSSYSACQSCGQKFS